MARFHALPNLASLRLSQAVGDFVRDYAGWALWVTPTFRDSVSDGAAQRTLKRWLRSLAQFIDDHIVVAWGNEPQRRGVPHYHTLLASGRLERASPYVVEGLWREAHPLAGHPLVEEYSPTEGAAHYQSRHEHWDINVACPRHPVCRRDGCRSAPGPW